jgi:hypothetical protein
VDKSSNDQPQPPPLPPMKQQGNGRLDKSSHDRRNPPPLPAIIVMEKHRRAALSAGQNPHATNNQDLSLNVARLSHRLLVGSTIIRIQKTRNLIQRKIRMKTNQRDIRRPLAAIRQRLGGSETRLHMIAQQPVSTRRIGAENFTMWYSNQTMASSLELLEDIRCIRQKSQA